MAGGRPKKEIDDIVIRGSKIGLTECQLAYLLDTSVEYIEENYSKMIEDNLPADYMDRRLRRYYKCYPRERVINNYKEKRKDPKFCIECSMRAQMAYHIKKNNVSKKAKTFHAIGYTIDELMQHLESQFSPIMTWDNYGEVWHIDHKRPVSWFNYNGTNDDEFKECWALSNLQPLLATDNIRKGNRWEG